MDGKERIGGYEMGTGQEVASERTKAMERGQTAIERMITRAFTAPSRSTKRLSTLYLTTLYLTTTLDCTPPHNTTQHHTARAHPIRLHNTAEHSTHDNTNGKAGTSHHHSLPPRHTTALT